MAKKVERFEASNGKLFKTEEDCDVYEAHDEAYKELEEEWFDQAIESFSDLTVYLQFNRNKIISFLDAADNQGEAAK